GLYADAVLQLGRHRNTLSPLDGERSGSKGSSWLASLELGRAYALGGWTLEPQLQLVHQRVDLDESSLVGARVQQDEDSITLLRAGLRLKGRVDTASGLLQPYARVNLFSSSQGSDTARFTAGSL